MHDEAVMRDVNAEHRRDIEKLERAISEKETALKASHRFWRKPVLSTPEIDRLRGDLKDAKSRLADCETIRQRAEDAGRKERRSLANQAENQRLQRPSKLVDLEKRRRALNELRNQLAERPWTIFGGLEYLRRRLDRITDYLRRPYFEPTTMGPESGTDVGLPRPRRR